MVYNFDMVGGGYMPPVMVCRDTQGIFKTWFATINCLLGSCHRDTCECDRVFAQDLSNQFDYYNEEYEHTNGFDQSICIGNGRNRGFLNFLEIFINFRREKMLPEPKSNN